MYSLQHKSRHGEENSHDDLDREDVIENEVIREEDFPTLNEWLDDRDVLYRERLRYPLLQNVSLWH